MATKNRSDLKSYFVRNAIPTEGNYADLIDSQLNQAQDGVFKPDGEALSVVAAPGDPQRALRLYASYPASNPDWTISLHPAQDPANAATARPGFGITDGAGRTRLFIDAATGQIGVGTNAPQVALDVAGAAQANGFRGRYDLTLNDYRTVNPASNVCLQSPANDRDAWIYRDPGDSANNWGIYHRQIDTPVGNLPGNSIGFVGGSGSKLQAYVNLADGSGYFAGNLSVQTRVGIGTTAPQASLDVTNGSRFAGGRHYFTDSEGTNRVRVGTAWGVPGLYSEDNQDIVIGCVGGKKVHLGQLNTVTVQDGTLTASTVRQTSDERLKDNIEPIPGALAKIIRLRGVSFDWKADHRLEGSPKHLGLIAQQVRQIVPEAVMDGNEGLLSIAYNAIAALLIEAVKEQQQHIDEQQKHIDELRAVLLPAPAS